MCCPNQLPDAMAKALIAMFSVNVGGCGEAERWTCGMIENWTLLEQDTTGNSMRLQQSGGH